MKELFSMLIDLRLWLFQGTDSSFELLRATLIQVIHIAVQKLYKMSSLLIARMSQSASLMI